MPDWDLSNVNAMVEAFKYRSVFNGNIGSCNVSSVTNQSNIFLL
ncbi:MAG: hypothetical protein ACJAVD_001006 [Porticoccaceae bacterium]|jgi:hypothetical protein